MRADRLGGGKGLALRLMAVLCVVLTVTLCVASALCGVKGYPSYGALLIGWAIFVDHARFTIDDALDDRIY
jgi:hypothetical protein